MKTLEIHGSGGDSTIMIGERLRNLKTYIPVEKTVIITDTNVRRLYQKEFPPCEVIEIGSGEAIKTLDTVQFIYEKLVNLEADRSAFIVGIGGGIVCDIAGFVASTYLRGVRFGFVSSTLLSQVDASVGGKNGVNFKGYKNMVGVFNQPEFVICDLNLLKTLPESERLCGFAEIVKHAAIADPDLFAFLEENHEAALELDTKVIEKLVCDSVVIKSSVVNQDEKEKGERRKLNFGHTLGHAIEKTAHVRHGEAVSAGMVAACAISVNRGCLAIEDAKRVETLLHNLKLPTRLEADRENALDALKKDKKREGEHINFVLLDAIGHAIVEEIPIRELEKVIRKN
ncbi:3-dehydroquinate synthase [Desulfonema magnum]|uniref:3-dehydroquinate synthase n=1 Tax=Desulfonema magnum TaxID=45655 RepID=A0A975BM18_9BACT|nr:3-dehydroquinate synthase [Desulfonema magnum]QTA87950.1 3-dehydroquinate synthase [Desulfonema magnum]